MSINFPSKSEVKLGRSPLDEVVCQVKFPPILRIVQNTPIEYQEAIRKKFPILEVEQGIIVQFPNFMGQEEPLSNALPKIFRFFDRERNTHTAISTDFYALSTKKYTHWDEFLSDLQFSFEKFTEIYELPYSTRIGLRFVNRFTKGNTGISKLENILSLFRNEMTCLYSTEVWKNPDEMISQILLTDKQAKLTLRFGVKKDQRDSHVLLDFDYFEEGQINIESLSVRLSEYHTKIHNAFRWCILDSSLERFNPYIS